MRESFLVIHFFVPKADCETVKAAMFAAGAGKAFDDNYDHCAWQTEGIGQFRALEGANPVIGNKHLDETVEEYKVEIVCNEVHIDAVIAALKLVHPYEVPAYYVTQAWR